MCGSGKHCSSQLELFSSHVQSWLTVLILILLTIPRLTDQRDKRCNTALDHHMLSCLVIFSGVPVHSSDWYNFPSCKRAPPKHRAPWLHSKTLSEFLVFLKIKKYSRISALLAVQCLSLWNLTGHLDFWQHQVNSSDISNFKLCRLNTTDIAAVRTACIFLLVGACLWRCSSC